MDFGKEDRFPERADDGAKGVTDSNTGTIIITESDAREQQQQSSSIAQEGEVILRAETSCHAAFHDFDVEFVPCACGRRVCLACFDRALSRGDGGCQGCSIIYEAPDPARIPTDMEMVFSELPGRLPFLLLLQIEFISRRKFNREHTMEQLEQALGDSAEMLFFKCTTSDSSICILLAFRSVEDASIHACLQVVKHTALQ
eukprot:jgi/Chlat1/5885/Chrsp4S00496